MLLNYQVPLTVQLFTPHNTMSDQLQNNQQQNRTMTENGALSLATTGSGRVNFFFKMLRDTTQQDAEMYLKASHEESADDTIKLVFQLRDARGGKGERKQFLNCIRWYVKNGYQEEIIGLLGLIPYYGRWKDLLELLDLGDTIATEVYKLFGTALTTDRERYDNNLSISLCAKWAPTEGGEYDKKYGCVAKIARQMGITLKTYRREYLSKLRVYSNTTEVWMCSRKWSEIQYEKVASVCMNRNSKVFAKHDKDNFEQYLKAVKSGDKKINASVLFPHTLVAPYIKGEPLNETTELQWKALVQKCKTELKDSLGKCLSICDVSGSMTGTPLDVCIGLGLLMSELIEEPFGSQLITFASNPQFCAITGETLFERVDQAKGMNWGGSTNLQATFELILQKQIEYELPPELCPTTIFLFSDMQFNMAVGNGYFMQEQRDQTNFEYIQRIYETAGYKRPKLVFWNLRSSHVEFPVTADESNVALVSGFSQSLLKLFMEGKEINPYQIMCDAIDDDRYNMISMDSQGTDLSVYYS